MYTTFRGRPVWFYCCTAVFTARGWPQLMVCKQFFTLIPVRLLCTLLQWHTIRGMTHIVLAWGNENNLAVNSTCAAGAASSVLSLIKGSVRWEGRAVYMPNKSSDISDVFGIRKVQKSLSESDFLLKSSFLLKIRKRAHFLHLLH